MNSKVHIIAPALPASVTIIACGAPQQETPQERGKTSWQTAP